jgi:hypothetical protein
VESYPIVAVEEPELVQNEQERAVPPMSPTQLAAIEVSVAAPYVTTSWDDRDPDHVKFDLPLLYLHRQHEPAPAADRTLDILLAGLPTGLAIQIEAVSRHADVTTGKRHIRTQRFVPDRPCTSDAPCLVQWTFDDGSTHSDLYDLRVKDLAGSVAWETTSPDRPDFAMLETWDVGVDDYVVRIYYATLFPFARATDRLDRRLAPAQVADFIADQFVPIIQETWQTQMHEWGFGEPIHPEWDADKVVEIIINDPPFALNDGTGSNTVFTHTDWRNYTERRIWWQSTHNAFQAYDSLANAYKAVFAHEFFHLAQWNVVLSAGGSTKYWLNTFMEAQGKFAPTVHYPELELAGENTNGFASQYIDTTHRFLLQRPNTSYRELESGAGGKYDAAIYWRFLYEQFNGMEVVRAALEEMACHYNPDIVLGIGEVMGRTFERLDGPFHTYEESLVAFARANYGLWLENGRCTSADLGECGGFYYDPAGSYLAPLPEAELSTKGGAPTYNGAIPASYGMDFVEVELDPGMQGQSLAVRLEGAGDVARFNVEIWKLARGEAQPGVAASQVQFPPGDSNAGSATLPRPSALTPQPETVPQSRDGGHLYVIHSVDLSAYDRLALLITRLDADEAVDPLGEYHITLETQADLGS